MAEYLILINEDESAYASASPDVLQEVMEAHNRFAKQVEETGGSIVSGRALQPTSTATSVRGDVVTDGPFAETKEALGGFYLVEARDLDQALEIAKLCPAPLRRRRGAADHGLRRHVTGSTAGGLPAEPGSGTGSGAGNDRPRRLTPWPTRTVASGPSCSPRRRASPGTSTWPRSASRTPTSSALRGLVRSGRAAQSRRLADHDRPAPGHRPAAARHHPAQRSSRCWSSPARPIAGPEPTTRAGRRRAAT